MIARSFWSESPRAGGGGHDCLPAHLRIEDNENDLGLHAIKQNHYRQTGQVIMMDKEYPEYANDYNTAVDDGSIKEWL